MLDRFTPMMRFACLGLAAILCYQWSRLATQKDPLENLNISSIQLTSLAPGAATNPPATNAAPSREPVKKDAKLPPELQARVDKITQSEILGPVIRPLPMALLGIAGKDAFLRAPNGQTGLLREGEELGGVKLLRIGTNRVLIEHEQQQKELTLFSGLGSETLLPKGKENPK